MVKFDGVVPLLRVMGWCHRPLAMMECPIYGPASSPVVQMNLDSAWGTTAATAWEVQQPPVTAAGVTPRGVCDEPTPSSVVGA